MSWSENSNAVLVEVAFVSTASKVKERSIVMVNNQGHQKDQRELVKHDTVLASTLPHSVSGNWERIIYRGNIKNRSISRKMTYLIDSFFEAGNQLSDWFSHRTG